jgi:hypothetical protein
MPHLGTIVHQEEDPPQWVDDPFERPDRGEMGCREILRERVLDHLIAVNLEGVGGVEDFNTFQISTEQSVKSAIHPCSIMKLDPKYAHA